MVLIIQEPRAQQPEGQEIVPFEDLVEFGDGASAFALTISSTRPCEHARWRLQIGTLDVNARADAR